MKSKRLISFLLAAFSVLLVSSALTTFFPGGQSNGAGSKAFLSGSVLAKEVKHKAKNVVYLTCITPQQSGYISMQRVVQKYQKEVNPNFKMDIQYIADKPAYLQKVKTLIASNEAPDMFNIDTDPYANALLKQGILKNLNPVMKEYQLKEVFLPAPLSWGRTSNGVQIALPIDYSIEVFWYNKKMFADAGVTPPKTFAEFLDVCAKLQAKNYTPISISGKEQWTILRYLLFLTYRYGDNKFLLDLARGKQKMSGRIGMQAAQFVSDLGTKGYFQPGFASTDYTGALNYFLGGKAAMYYMGTWDLPFFQDDKLNEKMKGNVDYFALPSVNKGRPVGKVNFAAMTTMPIGFAADKFDQETKEFINFYAHNIGEASDGMAFSCNTSGKLPNNAELTKKIAKDMKTSTGSIKLFDIELDPVTNALIGKEAVSLALGNITPKEFAARVDASIQENAPNFFK